MMETLSETEFAISVPAKTFIPNVYVDITDFIEKKIDIMRLFPKQLMSEPYPRSLGEVRYIVDTIKNAIV